MPVILSAGPADVGARRAVAVHQQGDEDETRQDEPRACRPAAEGEFGHDAPEQTRCEQGRCHEAGTGDPGGEETLSLAALMARRRTGSTKRATVGNCSARTSSPARMSSSPGPGRTSSATPTSSSATPATSANPLRRTFRLLTSASRGLLVRRTAAGTMVHFHAAAGTRHVQSTGRARELRRLLRGFTGVLQRGAGVHAVGAGEFGPVAVGADEHREFVLAAPQLLDLGLLVLGPAGEAGRSTLRQPLSSLNPSRGSTDQGSRFSRADSSART